MPKISRTLPPSLVIVLASLLVGSVSAEAVWYAEICYAGPRYKVRVDPITGGVVPVFENFTEIDDDSIDEDFPWDEFLFNNDPFTYPVEGSNSKDTESSGGMGIHRLLRSSRFWGNNNIDQDTETNAIVISNGAAKNNFQKNFPKEERRHQRFLQNGSAGYGEIDLEEGEFYVKPCLCSTSRWTFRNDDGSSSTIDTNTTSGFPINRFNIPHNFGRHSNGKYVYVPDNRENGDLYLCNAQAAYCGVPISDTVVKCYKQNTRPMVVRNAWPVVWILYWGLAVCCCCTFHGRVALGFVQDHLTRCCKRVVCCSGETSYDFNDRMLHRMIDDEERTMRVNPDGENNTNGDETNKSRSLPSCCSDRRLKFERKVLALISRLEGEETTFRAWLAFLGFKSTN